jgi:hypothetical protein
VCAALAVFLPHGGENGAGEDGGLRARRESGPFGQAKVVEEGCDRPVSVCCRAVCKSAREEVVGRIADS